MTIDYNIDVPAARIKGRGKKASPTLIAFREFMDSDNQTMRMVFDTAKEAKNAYTVVRVHMHRHKQYQGKYGVRMMDKECYVWKKEEDA